MANNLEINLAPGRIIANKYKIISLIGKGWEGEVYLVKELDTAIEHAAKIFYPKRNEKDKAINNYAKKLYKLKNCPLITNYQTSETIIIKKQKIKILISEYVNGELLSNFVKKQPGKRVHYFEALNILYLLAKGTAQIHNLKEYHGDIHDNNIIIKRIGNSFEIKLIDFYQLKESKAQNIYSDVCDLIRVFYDILGGTKHYQKLPKEIKQIICGLKTSLILKKYRNAQQLSNYIENFSWNV